MEIVLIVILAIIIIAMGANTAKEKKTKNQDEKSNKDEFDYSNGYKSKWLFSYNEKDTFRKIKDITDEIGLHLFTKVRLYDLIEPKDNIERKQGHVFKIQAKHVDFVICDEKLVARLIIELDDSSHDRISRKERDKFVDTVLKDCGYEVLHIKAVDRDVLKKAIENIFKPIAGNKN